MVIMQGYYSTSLVHYHGYTIRKLFIMAAFLMLLTLPFFNEELPVPTLVSLLGILVIGFSAAFTNPVTEFAPVLDFAVSAVGFAIFEYQTITGYAQAGPDMLFWINQVLAAIFLATFYLSTKTVRAMELKQR